MIADPSRPARGTAATPAAAAGYSGTPLAKKLGLKSGMQVWLHAAPEHYPALVAPLPEPVFFLAKLSAEIDLAHIFCTRRAELAELLLKTRELLGPEAVLWVSWPKKTAKLDTDITEDAIRELCLPLGWVDVKVCAVDAVWSGLKLVVRKELR